MKSMLFVSQDRASATSIYTSITYYRLNHVQNLTRPVWTDWAILKGLGDKLSNKEIPGRYLVISSVIFWNFSLFD